MTLPQVSKWKKQDRNIINSYTEGNQIVKNFDKLPQHKAYESISLETSQNSEYSDQSQPQDSQKDNSQYEE